jgi:fatty-acyl-CoA synthase
MFVEEWPLTGSGKIQKFKLLENFEQGMYQEQTA